MKQVAEYNNIGPIYDNPLDHDNLKMLQDPSISAHVTRPLVQGLQEFTIIDKDVSCRFRVKLNYRSNTVRLFILPRISFRSVNKPVFRNR